MDKFERIKNGPNSFLTKGIATRAQIKNGAVGFRACCRDQLLERIAKVGECWKWTGTKNRQGYGQCYLGNGQALAAHILSYLLFKGPVGKNYVCHSCDDPACVNPEHLWLGSHADNMNDAISKGRKKSKNLFTEAANRNPPGRPRLGDYRLECSVPRAVKNRLIELGAQRGISYTRVAAEILTEKLIGGVVNR